MFLSQVIFLIFLSSAAIAACPPFAFNVNNTKFDSKLPNPFLFHNGEKVVTKADWECKRAELSALIQAFEYGNLPPNKPVVTASRTNSSIVIDVSEGSKKISFSVTVRRPQGEGPFPAVIALAGVSIPVSSSIALITLNHDHIAQQSGQQSRGRGKFYDLYGSNYPAGTFLATTWAVSRVIDALEQLGSSVTGIQETRLAVSGCSRNGKAALFVGAFEPRIALTIPQEAGPSGPGLWRLWSEYRCRGICIPVMDPSDGITENPWFRKEFGQYLRRASVIPYDHHELMGLIAPRGLLLLENNIDWLQPANAVVGAQAARFIYQALGDKTGLGFVSPRNHAHCNLPADQVQYIEGFFDRFLHGKRVVTDVFVSEVKEDVNRYIDWTPPKELE